MRRVGRSNSMPHLPQWVLTLILAVGWRLNIKDVGISAIFEVLKAYATYIYICIYITNFKICVIYLRCEFIAFIDKFT